MKPIVAQVFPKWIVQFEGRTHFMYLDVLGLVTTGVGNLIDPMPTALGLHWLDAQGNMATVDAIEAEWRYVKSRVDLAPLGGGHFEAVTTLRLSDASVDDLVEARLAENERVLCERFAGWESYPASCQLAIHSMAWAMGDRFRFPVFQSYCEAGMWADAANQCHIRNATAARNAANRALLLQADDLPTY